MEDNVDRTILRNSIMNWDEDGMEKEDRLLKIGP